MQIITAPGNEDKFTDLEIMPYNKANEKVCNCCGHREKLSTTDWHEMTRVQGTALGNAILNGTPGDYCDAVYKVLTDWYERGTMKTGT